MIDALTDVEFTHASISFDDNIQPMYSFGRKLALVNLPAGLKKEPLTTGFFKYHKGTDLGIYTLEVSDEGCEKMKQYINSLFEDDQKWRFNILGLILAKQEIELQRNHKMFCSEFVASCLLASGEIDIGKAPSLYHPIDFTKLDNIKCIYKGKITDAIDRHFDNVVWKE